MASQNEALEFGRVLVPQLCSLTVERARTVGKVWVSTRIIKLMNRRSSLIIAKVNITQDSISLEGRLFRITVNYRRNLIYLLIRLPQQTL